MSMTCPLRAGPSGDVVAAAAGSKEVVGAAGEGTTAVADPSFADLAKRSDRLCFVFHAGTETLHCNLAESRLPPFLAAAGASPASFDGADAAVLFAASQGSCEPPAVADQPGGGVNTVAE